jgi:DNA-binding CsgD family transcriptional regulator
VLFDLPHSGSQRRRAEPSPLSRRETAVLRRLADGKLYEQIGAELGVSASTIRTYLSNVYVKLLNGEYVGYRDRLSSYIAWSARIVSFSRLSSG